MLLGIKPTVDFVFKKVFGSPENIPVLIGLLNAILKLAHPIVHVEILNPFSYQEFADDKLVVLDIRARDSAGRWLNIEMQVTVFAGLLQRLVYYACTMYVGQLEPGIEVSDSIEVHTVELTKYNLREETISSAPAIEQWAFFFLFADQYEPQRLRELLPGIAFQQAISVVEAIAAKSEDRMMYDQRLKAQRDYCPEAKRVQAAIGGRETDRFPNVELIETLEQPLYFDARHESGFYWASPVQSWLELMRGDKRDRETAAQVRESILRAFRGGR